MTFPYTIKGQHIILQHPRQPSFALAQELFAAIDASRDTLSKWLPWPKNTKRPEDEFAALQDWQTKWQEKKSFAYIIRDMKSKKLLGMIEFMFADMENRSGEIGYWLSSAAEGHGYM
jgi:ribosomal-protein-serine acetyltransferase